MFQFIPQIEQYTCKYQQNVTILCDLSNTIVHNRILPNKYGEIDLLEIQNMYSDFQQYHYTA